MLVGVREGEREICSKELAHEAQGPVCLKSMGQTCRLDTQFRVDAATLSLNLLGQQSRN